MQEDDELRKILLSPVGLAVLCGSFVFAWLTFFVTGDAPKAVLGNAIVAAFAGFLFSKGFRKNNSYILEKARNNELGMTRKFGKMVRREEIPESEEDQRKYLEYLESIEKNLNRSLRKANLIPLGLIATIMILSSVFMEDRLASSRLLPGIAAFGIIFSVFTMRKQMQKIQRLKSRLLAESPKLAVVEVGQESLPVHALAPTKEPHSKRILLAFTVSAVLAFLLWYIISPHHPLKVIFFGAGLREKAMPYLEQACLDEEQKEKIDLDCEGVRLYEKDNLVSIEHELPDKSTEIVWAISGWTWSANGNYSVELQARMSQAGKYLYYAAYYFGYEGEELKVSPRDYVPPKIEEEDYAAPAEDTQYVEYDDDGSTDTDEWTSPNEVDVPPDFQLEVEQ